jgi:hypothetical protein
MDVAEAWLTVTFVAVLALAGPLLAWYTGVSAFHHGQQAARAAQKSRVQVNAVVLEDATGTTPAQFAVARTEFPVRARWYALDTTLHVGEITLASPARAGSVVPVWIDAKGDPVSAPPRRQDVVERAVAIGASTLLGVGCVVAVWWLAVRHLFQRRRMDRWQAAWSLVEPQWSGRRG